MAKKKNTRIKSQTAASEMQTDEVSLEVLQEQEAVEQICTDELSEPEHPEPVLAEPEHPEPVLAEPEQPEPVLAEPEQPEPVSEQPEPVLAEPEQPESVLAEPERPESVSEQPEPVLVVNDEVFEEVVLVTPEVTQKDIQNVRKYMDDEEEEIRVTRSAKRLFCVLQ